MGSLSERKGIFIVFEGIDGSGKSTQIYMIEQKLFKLGKKYAVTKEPTDGEVGRLLKKYLTRQIDADSRLIASLFASDRLDHIFGAGGLKELIYCGDPSVVLCDRYYLSSYAYQSMDTPLDWLMALNSVSAAEMKPDCHFFLDLSPGEAVKRIKSRGNAELYEEYDKLKIIYENYHKSIKILKEQYNENIVIINADRHVTDIAEDIWNVIEGMLIV